MPTMQTMVARLNTTFSPSNIGSVDPVNFDPGKDLVQAAVLYGIATTTGEQDYLRKMPESLREAIRSMIHCDTCRKTRLPISWAWLPGAPGAGWEMTICEVAGTATSPGGITVVLRTPMPGSVLGNADSFV